MKYFPQKAIGVRIDDKIAKLLECEEAWSAWDGKDSEFEPLLEAVGDFCGFEPDSVRKLVEERGGYVTGLKGFTSGCTYVMFDPEFVLDEDSAEEWNETVKKLQSLSIEVVDGSWSQLM
jgi:hypothetical protein